MKTPLSLKSVSLNKLSVGDEVLYPNQLRPSGVGTTGIIAGIFTETDSIKVAWDNGVGRDYNYSQRATILWYGPLIAEEIV